VGQGFESSLRTNFYGGQSDAILRPQIRVPLLDLLLFKRGRRFGVKIKRIDAAAHTLDAHGAHESATLRARISIQ
jgi:hypothetical protein